MSTPKDWRPSITADDWFREREKRQAHEERRPQVQHASDLLGPGFGPYAVPLLDWNSDAARFNGMWSAVDALNGPALGTHLGLTLGAQEGHATQVAFGHEDGSVWVRQVHMHDASAPDYTPWKQVAPASQAVDVGTMVGWPTGAAVPAGYLAANGLAVPRSEYAALADLLAIPATAATFTVPNVANSGGMRTIIKA